MTHEELTRRAMAAYFRTGGTEQPAGGDVVEHDGREYVVLANVTGVLAVYRVRTDGVLKRLRRWPTAITP